MQTVNIHEAKTQLSRFVEQAAAGDEIVIARAGKPMARLVQLPSVSAQSRQLGLGKGQYTMPTAFDDMQTDQIVNMFEQGA